MVWSERAYMLSARRRRTKGASHPALLIKRSVAASFFFHSLTAIKNALTQKKRETRAPASIIAIKSTLRAESLLFK